MIVNNIKYIFYTTYMYVVFVAISMQPPLSTQNVNLE